MPAIDFRVGERTYRMRGKKVWVQAFGTTGPGQTPHYSWVAIQPGTASYQEALIGKMKALRELSE